MKKYLILLPLAVACSCAGAADRIFADGLDSGGSCVTDPHRVRMFTTTVGYNVHNTGSLAVDATQFETIFGRASVSDPSTLPFPGVTGTGPVFHWIFSGQYYSGWFHTPPTGRYTGSLAFQSNDSRGCVNVNGTPGPCGQPYYDVSISRQCNDYGDSATYAVLNAPSDGSPHLGWSMGYVSGDLEPDTDYYLNIRMHDPADFWHMAYMIWYGYRHD
jgi:hypothetical protein